MTTRLRILVPEGTTNYVTNPSFRYDTTDWNLVGSTITRVLDYARFGISALKVVTNGAALNEGVYFRTNDLNGINDVLTASAYVRGVGDMRIRLIDNPSGKEWKSKTVTLRNDIWTRIEVTGACTGSNDVRIYLESAFATIKTMTFYVDAVQLERKAYSTTFCDGEQTGCRWNGIYSDSTSTRSAYTREGGRWITISGDDREEPDIYMTFLIGAGVAPVDLNRQAFALNPGSYLDNIKVKERAIGMIFHTKDNHVPRTAKQAQTMAKLHSLRQQLIDIIKPDKTAGNEPFLIEYTDGSTPLYLKVYYEGGLEGDWDIRNHYIMNFQLRLLAVSPFFVEGDKDAVQLDFQNNTMDMEKVAGRIDGEWNILNYGINTAPTDLVLGKRGEIYIGNVYGWINASPKAIDPYADGNRIAYWNGIKWTSLATSVSAGSSSINSVAVAPNGDIYVTGAFTSISGVAVEKIAKYSISTGTWSALGSGLNDDGLHVQVAPNGDVYVGGKFTSAGGVTAYRVARWDGTGWNPLDISLGVDMWVNTIAISKDGKTVYIGGLFLKPYGAPSNTLNRVAKYDVATNRLSPMGDGFDDDVREIIISDSGYVYAAGDFTTGGVAPFPSLNRIAKWNGSMWEQLGNGFDNGIVYSMDISERGDIVAVGTFTSALGVAMKNIGHWNGSGWVPADIIINMGETIELFVSLFSGNDFYVAGYWNNTRPTIFSGITYVTNEGSTEVRPIIYIKGQAHLSYLENQTTKARLWFDLDINEDEEVFIDFGTGKFYSTVRGDLFYSLQPGSDFHAFSLIPGVNKIAAFMHDDVDAIMYMYYTPTHWSADATENEESL